MHSMLATEVPPNFMTSRPMMKSEIPVCEGDRLPAKKSARPQKGAYYIPARWDDRNRGRAGFDDRQTDDRQLAGAVHEQQAADMARYIDEILQPDEKVLYSTSVHWIFYTPGIVAWIIALVCWIMERR